MDPEVEGVPRIASMEGVYRGHGGIRRWWSALFGAFPDLAFELGEMRDLGDLTLTAVRIRGSGSGSGTPVDEAVWHLAWWDDGKCTRWGIYDTEREALGASGRAMSQENVAVVEEAYEALANAGLDRFLDHWSDDLDHRSIKGAPDDRGPIHGKDAMRAYVQDWMDTFDEFRIEPVELIDTGDGVVFAVVRYGGRAQLSGIELDETFAVVFTIRDHKIARGREYATRAEALEAAGLSE
jgi:ketosteroid isomerase-like protein